MDAFPQDHVMLLTLNRPKALNAVSPTMQGDIERVLDWFDNEPSLWVVIINGEGRIFCAGADLIAWHKRRSNNEADSASEFIDDKHGFAGISRRTTSGKPIIAAVHGGAYGGGTDDDAVFALPEVKRGVVAIAGGMPRLGRIAGHQLASEMLLLGKPIKASDAASRFGFVNKVVPKPELLPTALAWAAEITSNSPDSVQSTKRALLLTNQHAHVEDVVEAHVRSKEGKQQLAGDNMKEGLRAFTERRKPVWSNPAKL
ncbi:enoyl-CoA hydratase/carnithine racemase [Fomitopsis serialis]|uniref:enoyl-CoA hydratase/carnithine racemase n=1 Tax=Fomitopsis serialis TaxID=139415 RepID=UPI002008234F|nr:enoyl-CoA hydratase/carnithine racemase [Neoantrodia serialis]KAH9929737.1 enoyl-CoA hydratase/carnithine racemase [Neoantrodia serialis]